jgi:hypothetical protein
MLYQPSAISGVRAHTGSTAATAPTPLRLALLGDVTPQLMVTDPPYGVDYDPSWRHRMVANKSMRRGKVRNDYQAD